MRVGVSGAFVALAFLVASPGAWALYKCADAGVRVAFQDTPCQGAGTRLDVKPASGAATAPLEVSTPTTGSNSQAVKQTEAERLERILSQSQSGRRKVELEARLVPDATAALRDLRTQCDSQMSRLRAQKAAANNNLAGATWEVSLSGEMTAVATRCDTQQRELREDLDTLTKEGTALGGCRR